MEGRIMNTDKEKHVIHSELNRAIKERIEYLEQEEPDNLERYKLKLLQSDNISEYDKFCIIFSTQDKTKVFVNNTSLVNQLSEEGLCCMLLKMCSTTDKEDEKAMINTSIAEDLEYEDQTSLTFLQPLSSLLRIFREFSFYARY